MGRGGPSMPPPMNTGRGGFGDGGRGGYGGRSGGFSGGRGPGECTGCIPACCAPLSAHLDLMMLVFYVSTTSF